MFLLLSGILLLVLLVIPLILVALISLCHGAKLVIENCATKVSVSYLFKFETFSVYRGL
jgi:hypothetical protein